MGNDEGKLRVLDLFSGIGGFSLGLERTGGFETVAFCEIEPFCRRVLKKHWPDVPVFGDVRELTGEQVGSVDVICGGFPCQPFSHAGKRRGAEDDRHLWPEMLRLINACRPTWVVGENVAGLISMVKSCSKSVVESRTGGCFADGIDYTSVTVRQEDMLLNDVCEDLDQIGYEIIPFVIPACAVDAPHRRDRVWIMARDAGGKHGERGRQKRKIQSGADAEPDGICDVANAQRTERRPHQSSGNELNGKTAEREEKAGRFRASGPHDRSGTLADADGERKQQQKGAIGEIGGWPGDSGGASGTWLAEPGVGRVAHGVPGRVDRLRSLGNAVVPQVVEMIGRAILAAERWQKRMEKRT